MTSDKPDGASALAARAQVGKLLKAAQDGNLTTLKDVATELSNGQDLASALDGVKDAHDRGPLHFAARSGKVEIAQYLLEEVGMQVDPVDKEGETPLIHATRLGFDSTAQYLLDHGANPHAAALDVETSAIHHAAGTGSLDLMKVLLDKGIDVNLSSSSGSPLIWAAGHGRLEAVKFLLERGADPNFSTEDEVTPLLTAAAAKFPEIVELLVKNGANVNIVAGGVTPLHVAAEQGGEDMVGCLLGAGANTDVVDDDGIIPIEAAAVSGHRNIVDMLLPVTKPLGSVSNWSTDGLMSHGEHLSTNAQAVSNPETNGNASPEELEKHIEVSPERKQKALDAKARGTTAFKKGNFMEAIDNYTQANDLDPTNAEVLCNRSLCWIRLGQGDQALIDAEAARKLAPTWAKAHYREGSALRLLQRFAEAAAAFYSGVQLDPENKELVNAFKEATEAGRKFHGTI